jgi:hypothetical protein
MTKVFWSWQSDRPGKTGRHFVRDAIQEAIDSILAAGELEESQRGLHLDHDRNASGSPDLARLILQKVKASAIFIADVTRIGQSDDVGDEGNLKPLINPNVAIELGYALATVELRLILGDGVNQAADLASGATSIPSWNLTPWMTFGNWF